MLTPRLTIATIIVVPKFIKFNTRKFRNDPGHTHFFTFSTVGREPFFAREEFCLILVQSIVRAKAKHNFAVLAYVFMPDHIHLVIFPLNEVYDMSEISKSIKLSFTKAAQRRGLVEHVIWEPGGGYDRNVYTQKERLEKIRYTHLNPIRNGLAEDLTSYRWSSAKWYLTGEPGDIECHFRDELNQD